MFVVNVAKQEQLVTSTQAYVSSEEEATTTRTPDECNESTRDFFDMQPHEDLGLLGNTSENAEKIKYPKGNANYELEGVARQIAWVTIQSGRADVSAIKNAWEF